MDKISFRSIQPQLFPMGSLREWQCGTALGENTWLKRQWLFDSLFCIGTAPKAHSDSHSVTSKGTGGGLFLSWQPQPLGKRSSEIACEAPFFCRVTTDCGLLYQTTGQQELARLPWLREYQVVYHYVGWFYDFMIPQISACDVKKWVLLCATEPEVRSEKFFWGMFNLANNFVKKSRNRASSNCSD